MSTPNPAGPTKLPKGALTRVTLAHSFAEYDTILQKQGVFVETPAARAALDGSLGKCLFVGRRGSGKTAISLHLSATQRNVVSVAPGCLMSLRQLVTTAEYADTRQRPFHALTLTFKVALAFEAVAQWIKLGLVSRHDLPETLGRERSRIEQHDFDSRTLDIFEEVIATLGKGRDQQWFKWKRRLTSILNEVQGLATGDRWKTPILIDKVDDDWDGADESVIVLMGLMHACVELTAAVTHVRPLLFLRENLFERVRRMDNEFPRLETSVASLDWTRELLTDLVAKRLQFHLNPKPALPQVWGLFFEQPTGGPDVPEQIFDYCQYRPRDVLIYLYHAIESSKGLKHEQITSGDLDAAKKVFSENRLKDLGDEYSENYPNVHQILARFHGLAQRFTVHAVADLIKKLMTDPVVKEQCKTWMYSFTAPHQFIELLYGIGFAGIQNQGGAAFRGSGVKEAAVPHIDTAKTHMVVHPSYVHGLDLQDALATALDTSTPLQTEGVLVDLPGAIDPIAYLTILKDLQDQLDTLPTGDDHADLYQSLVGDVAKYCLFHTLGNPTREANDVDGRVRRDWIFSNRAGSDFWRMVQDLHAATQIIWECKNYTDLKAGDFHQLNYYLNKNIGSFAVVSFRGQAWDKAHYYQHIRRISEIHGGGMILLITDADLGAFLRQSARGTVKDGLFRDRYDKIKAKIT